jgi:hypothetical protein
MILDLGPMFSSFALPTVVRQMMPSCSSKTRIPLPILLLLMSGMVRGIPDFKQHDQQSSENEEMVDFPLFVKPDFITAVLKCLFMKGCPVAVDPVIVLNDKEKSRENPRNLSVKGLMG